MYKELEMKLFNTLKGEFDYIQKQEDTKDEKSRKIMDIFHMQQIITNFDELEPIIADYLNKKARKEKFER